MEAHEVFSSRKINAVNVFKRLKPLPQEVFKASLDKGEIDKNDFELLSHNWSVMENIRTGLGLGNNEPFVIEGSISGRFIPNKYDDIAYNILDQSWNYLLTFAPSGMGKSVKLRSHAEQVNLFYGLPVVRADRKPPWEDSWARFPSLDGVGRERLRRWNFAPMGLGKRLVLFRAPNTPIEAMDLKVDLAAMWEALSVEEELEDSFRRVFEILFEVKREQQKANTALSFLMSARPDTFVELVSILDGYFEKNNKDQDRYFYNRVKRSRRYIVNHAKERIDIDALLLKKWKVFLGGEKTLRPFFSLATDLFEGSTNHAFTEYYFHTLFYRLLKNGSLPALWDVNDEVDATRASPLLRELGFWKARKLRALNYCSESATQDISLFSGDMRDAAQAIQFGNSPSNWDFAIKFVEGMGDNVKNDLALLPDKYWCLVNKDKDLSFVYPARGSFPSFCGFPSKQKKLIA